MLNDCKLSGDKEEQKDKTLIHSFLEKAESRSIKLQIPGVVPENLERYSNSAPKLAENVFPRDFQMNQGSYGQIFFPGSAGPTRVLCFSKIPVFMNVTTMNHICGVKPRSSLQF